MQDPLQVNDKPTEGGGQASVQDGLEVCSRGSDGHEVPGLTSLSRRRGFQNIVKIQGGRNIHRRGSAIGTYVRQ